MTAQGYGPIAVEHLFLHSADGTVLEKDISGHWSTWYNEPEVSITLDPGVYILQVSSERRDCWSDNCDRIVVLFSGNVIPMADLPAQDVLNTFQVKQLTVGTTRLDTVNDSFHQVSVASTETQVTVQALPADDEDSVVITPGDADTNTAGHQVDLSTTGPDYVHVTVLGSDGLPQRTHLIEISR